MGKRSEAASSAGTVIHAGLMEVALLPAESCAAAGGMSVSWWHEEVRAGRAPAPVIQRPRCTRWRLQDVRKFWAALPSAVDAKTSDVVIAKARRASAAAKAVAESKRSRQAEDSNAGEPEAAGGSTR